MAALTCVATPAHAQIAAVADGDDIAATTRESPADPPPSTAPDEIVVTARRRGQAAIVAETELNADEIAAYGARSIGELIGNIAPLIDGKGDAPAILVNGKRIGSPAEINDYPPEALDRVAILPPEAAALYGYASGQRVVNLELKPKYASWDADAGVTVPTAGGRRAAQSAVGRTAIDGDARWNVQVSASDDTALLKSARRLPVRDDVLALLPTLPDREGEKIDPNRFESLVGEARSWNLNAGVNRPLGAFSGALSVNAALGRGAQLIGIPIGSIILPPGSRWVPEGAAPVTVSRLLGDGALRSGQRSASFGASATLSGPISGWQTNVSVLYAHSRSNNVYDRGYDVSAVQQRVDAGDPSFDPDGVWPATPLVSDRGRFRNDMWGATVNASRSVLTLPAGPVNMSLTANASRNRSHFTTEAGGAIEHDRSGSDQFDGLWSVSIPVANRALGVLAPLGDLGFDLSAEAGTATRTKTRHKWNVAVRWAPFSFLDLRATIGRENAEPTFDQRHAPQIEVITRLFDFAQQEYVQPVRIFGGNPELEGGRIRSLSMNAMIRPFAGDRATFTIGYRKQLALGAVAPFPTLTPDVEAAFPDRVTRDASGGLVAIDERPVNISQDRTESIATGLTLRATEKAKASGSLPNEFRPWTVSLSVNHGWQLKSEMEIRPGLPLLDRLRGSGQPRHNVAFNLVAGRRGLGTTLNGSWSSGAIVRSASGGAEFRYAPSFLFNLGLFVEPGAGDGEAEQKKWTSNLRISLDIQNVLNGYRRVSVSHGDTPRGYTRDEIDPLGRTVRLNVRKQF